MIFLFVESIEKLSNCEDCCCFISFCKDPVELIDIEEEGIPSNEYYFIILYCTGFYSFWRRRYRGTMPPKTAKIEQNKGYFSSRRDPVLIYSLSSYLFSVKKQREKK